MLGGSLHECVFGGPNGRNAQCCAERAPFPCGVSEMLHPSSELVAADLAKLINPGLRSPRTQLTVLPHMMIVQAELAGGTASLADAIEAVVNKGLAAMSAQPGEGMPRMASADPVKALRAALALRPGSERVKSKTRRTAAAQAMGLLSGDGWRAHHEKALLHDLAGVICSLEASAPAVGRLASVPARSSTGSGIARFYSDFVDIKDDWETLFAGSSTLDLAIMYGAANPLFDAVINASQAITDEFYDNPNIIDAKTFPPHLSLHICTVPRTSLSQVTAILQPLGGFGVTTGETPMSLARDPRS